MAALGAIALLFFVLWARQLMRSSVLEADHFAISLKCARLERELERRTPTAELEGGA